MKKKADDNVRQQLLDKLSEESIMVIETAYAYAKNYVLYGADITKAWTTAAQQAYILEQVRLRAFTEAYDSFKKDYENRLKADMTTIKQLSKSVKTLQKANSEIAGAYDKLKADYIARLKADMVAMLTEIQLEIEEEKTNTEHLHYDELEQAENYNNGVDTCVDIIQQKINTLKAESEE